MRNALTALREAYEEPVRQTATVLQALITIYASDALDGKDPDAFITSIGMVEPADWKRRLEMELARDDSLSRRGAFVLRSS